MRDALDEAIDNNEEYSAFARMAKAEFVPKAPKKSATGKTVR